MSNASRRGFLAGACAVPLALAQEAVKPAPSPSSSPNQAAAGSWAPDRLPEIPNSTIPKQEPGDGTFAGRVWKLQHQFDEEDLTVSMNDLRFMSAERGIALCSMDRKGRLEAQALLTRDGGLHWTQVKLKDLPLSLAMLNESQGYYVGRDGVWYTAEGGVSWEKRKLPRDSKNFLMLRAHFISEKQGWLFGTGKPFYSTEDGGLTWTKVPESDAINLTSTNVAWSWLVPITANILMLVGNSSSAPKDESRFPDWMMPERAARKRLTPSTTVLAETRDRGKTWKTSVGSTFGQVIRIRSWGTRAVSIFQYSQTFEFPSEVVEMDLSTGKSHPIFRRKDLVVQDAMFLDNGGVLVAALQFQGRLMTSPIPAKLRMFFSENSKDWREMKVDYRAAGTRAILTKVGDANIWVGTSEGMILKLT
jgi:hypothetical protein